MTALNEVDLTSGLRNLLLVSWWAAIASSRSRFPWDKEMESISNLEAESLRQLTQLLADFTGLQAEKFKGAIQDWSNDGQDFWSQEAVEVTLSLLAGEQAQKSLEVQDFPACIPILAAAFREAVNCFVGAALFERVGFHNSGQPDSSVGLRDFMQAFCQFLTPTCSLLKISAHSALVEGLRKWSSLESVRDRQRVSSVPQACDFVFEEVQNFLDNGRV